MTAMRLYINVDHVATLREARRTTEPDPVDAARLAEAAGADGITIHLREDRRHIQDHDLERLAESITTVLNVELALDQDVLRRVSAIRPYQATIVPERREEITTEGGLDLSRRDPRIRATIRALDEVGARVSLFIDPDLATIDAAKDLGVPAIELHTGRYAHHWETDDTALDELHQAIVHAADLGLAVHAGHGLTYRNVQPVARIPELEELNIGHSVMSRAILTGMPEAVRTMRELIDSARR